MLVDLAIIYEYFFLINNVIGPDEAKTMKFIAIYTDNTGILIPL